MNLMEQITNDMKEKMKEQDKFSLSVLRMLKSSLQLERISIQRELEDKDIISVIKRNVKQRKDSIVEFSKYGRQEEVKKLEQEIVVFSKYLPQELSESEIDQKIEEVFFRLKPESLKDMGRVMKVLTEEIGSVADMGIVSKKVKEKL